MSRVKGTRTSTALPLHFLNERSLTWRGRHRSGAFSLDRRSNFRGREHANFGPRFAYLRGWRIVNGRRSWRVDFVLSLSFPRAICALCSFLFSSYSGGVVLLPRARFTQSRFPFHLARVHVTIYRVVWVALCCVRGGEKSVGKRPASAEFKRKLVTVKILNEIGLVTLTLLGYLHVAALTYV